MMNTEKKAFLLFGVLTALVAGVLMLHKQTRSVSDGAVGANQTKTGMKSRKLDYSSTPHFVVEDSILKPKGWAGYEVEKLVANKKMRDMLDGRTTTLSNAGVGSKGKLFWIARHLIADAKLTRHSAAFSWSRADGLQMPLSQTSMASVRAVFFNPVEHQYCPKGAPILVGVAVQRSVVNRVIGSPDYNQAVPGAPTTGAVCLIEKDGKPASSVMFNFTSRRRVGVGDAWLSPWSSSILTSLSEYKNDVFDKDQREQVRKPAGLLHRIYETSLETNETKPRWTFGRETLLRAPFSNFVQLGKDGPLIGLTPRGWDLSLCEADSARGTMEVRARDCYKMGGAPRSIQSIAVNPEDVDRKPGEKVFYVGTASFNERSGPTLGRVVRMVIKKERQWKIKEITVIAAPFYSVINLNWSGNDLYVFDFVQQSRLGNDIYVVRATQ